MIYFCSDVVVYFFYCRGNFVILIVSEWVFRGSVVNGCCDSKLFRCKFNGDCWNGSDVIWVRN